LTTETVFSVGYVPRNYKRAQSEELKETRVEAGSNTSTVTLRVVGGDDKGGLESETVKYVGLGPENDCAGVNQQQL
jgi:hypothetical protein